MVALKKTKRRESSFLFSFSFFLSQTMEGYTPEQLEKLSQFKAQVANLTSTLPADMTTDHELVRWLLARAWSLEKAEEMFRNSIKWRREYKPDELLLTYKPNEVSVICCVLWLSWKEPVGRVTG
jgi:hypothetical protein